LGRGLEYPQGPWSRLLWPLGKCWLPLFRCKISFSYDSCFGILCVYIDPRRGIGFQRIFNIFALYCHLRYCFIQGHPVAHSFASHP
jgi:hypothetical protein